MKRLRLHYALSGERFWLEAFARQPDRPDAYGLPPDFGQYVCAYALAYHQAGATVYDEARMNHLLAEARALAGSPAPPAP